MQIKFDRFTKLRTVEYFLRHFNKGVKSNPYDKHIIIKIEGEFPTYPETIVPLAGILDFLKDMGFSLYVDYNDSPLSGTGMHKPYTVADNNYELLSPMYKVWKYNSPEEVYKIVEALVKHLNTKIICAKGVVEAFEWTVNEVMDNVIQHSQSANGYIMCTATSNSHISVAIYDNGIGIYKSFQGTHYRLQNAYDAIILAMQEGATRDKTIGQGNGLWGMSKLLANNKGSLSIASSEANVSITESSEVIKRSVTTKFSLGESCYQMGTLVDFQFQCNNEVSLTQVFGADYLYTNLNLEALEDENERIILKVNEFSFGYATRVAGERARKMAINYAIQSNYEQLILLDFAGVGIIASSFADEFVGKMIQYFGFVQFNSLFRIINVSEENMAIINRSIMQRSNIA